MFTESTKQRGSTSSDESSNNNSEFQRKYDNQEFIEEKSNKNHKNFFVKLFENR